jgi:hypothetical protein
VRGHDTPTAGLRELDTGLLVLLLACTGDDSRLDRLGDGTDLVDLQQQSVTRLLLDGGLDSEGVGNGQVITNDLDLGRLVEVGPSLPVVLGEGVLDGADVVLLGVGVVEGSELLTSEPLGGVGVGVLTVRQLIYVGDATHLEVKVVLALLVEFGGGNVETDLDLAGVASLLDGLGEELEGLLGTRDVGGETSLVTDVGGCKSALSPNNSGQISLPSMPYFLVITFFKTW